MDSRIKVNSEASSGRGRNVDDNGKNGMRINGENKRKSFPSEHRGKEGDRGYKIDKKDMTKEVESKRVRGAGDKDQ